MSTVEDFLSGGGSPSISWDKVPEGHTVTGKVVSSEVGQQRDYQTGEPKFWDDGKPMQQLVITLQNAEWVDDENPDGHRRLFAKGSKKAESKSMLAAVIEALRKAEAKLEPGGTLTVRYVGEGQAKGRLNPPKQYAAKYEKPAFDPDEEPW